MKGIDSLSRQNQYYRHDKRKARVAALCGLLPGMGAVYNRQNVKGVVHFVTVVGLFEMANVFIFGDLFGLAGFAFYVYSIIDAYRTAWFITQGGSAEADEERFKRSLSKRAPAIGLFLISVGLIWFLQITRPFGIVISLARLLPVLLIIFGGYLLTRYFKRSREEQATDYMRQPPYPLLPGPFSERGQRAAGRASNHGGNR